VFDLSGSGAEPLEAEDPRAIGAIPLVGRLGVGGMGRVYLGVHLGRYVAVKQVLPSIVGEDEKFLRRFGHELDNLARLPAEATAALLASDRTARPPWLATAYVPGLTLREAVDLNGGPLPVDALWLLVRDAAAGLAAVHALDMVHRDVKPSNVMLTLDGLTLIDFGVARAAEQSQLTSVGVAVGTPAYMAPEQASGVRRLTGAVDVFALGSVLAYAATGEPPFGDESGHGVLYRIVHEEPDLGPVRDLAPEFADLVAACLDKDPQGRPTAAELLELASEQGQFEPAMWPAVIRERLTERAAFAASVPTVDEVPAPVPTLPAAGPKPEPEPKAPEAGAGSGPGRRERRPRIRVFLAVVPVVVVVGGATLAIQHLPYTSDSGTEARSTPSVSAPASAGATPSASGARPSGTAKPAKHPSSGEGKATGGASAGAGGEGTARGTGVQDDSAGSGGGSGSGSSSSTSGGTSTKAPTSGGYYRIKNAADGQCLVMADYGGPLLGACSDSPASSWADKSLSGGGFQVVNEHTGQCLSVSADNVVAVTCDQSTQQSWRTGSGSTLQSLYNSHCLDESSGWPVTATCVAGTTSQRWTRT
jgi:eukaryotic-like serine/threonine-protein kinase